ncbi:unnamed protein product, partial [Iphiclides podalirius]
MSNTKEKFSPFLKQCFVTGAVCSNIAGHGSIIGFPAVLLPQLREKGSPITLTEDGGSWIASVLGITILVGNFITPTLMEKLGRKPAHFAVTLPIIAGWLITIFANSFEALLIGRVLQGLSFGMILPLGSVLVGEYTSPKDRGTFLMSVSLAQAFGIFFVHLVGSLLNWRKTAMICIFFSFASLLMVLFSPESPSWLAAKGKYDECKKVFRWLRGDGEEDELEELIRARVVENSKSATSKITLSVIIKVVKKREFLIPIVLMVHANAMMQFAGGTTMAAYSTTIIGLIMGPEASAHFWMVALDTQRLISNAIAMYVINKFKRRTMMFLTGGICVLSHIAIAGYVYAKLHGILSYDSIWIPALLINLQFFSVATGMVPLPNVIAGEVFPLEYRGLGGSISVISIAAFIFVTLKTFPGLIARIHLHGTYIVYALVLTYNLVVIWYLLPETKDRTLQQIEDEFKELRDSDGLHKHRLPRLRDWIPRSSATTTEGAWRRHYPIQERGILDSFRPHHKHADWFLFDAAHHGQLGRRTAHFIAAVPFLAGWLYTSMATSVQDLLIGRILQGVSSGLLTILRSVLIGEYTSPSNRGAFLTTISLAQAFGIFFVHLVGSLVSWQTTALICAFFAYTSFIMTMFTPESPSWLVARRRYDECRRVFLWLRGDTENEELDEMINVHVAHEKAKSQSGSAKVSRFESMLKTARRKEFYKPIVLMLHANVLMQFAGGTTMSAYSTVIIGLLMGPGVNAHFWMVFLDTQRIISNSMAVYVINRVKRRTMLFSTGALCVAAHVAIAAYVYAKDTGTLVYDALWLPVLLINVHFFTVAVGMVPMPNVIAGEVFPLEHRSVCGSISLTTSSGFMFLALKTFPQLVDATGLQGTYSLYAVLLTYNLTVIWMLLPETKGKTLQQIEEEFRGRPLRPEETEMKLVLRMDPMEAYRSKLSLRRCSSAIL